MKSLNGKFMMKTMIIMMMEINDKIVSFTTTIEELNANWNAL
jgi:hypothetical protein